MINEALEAKEILSGKPVGEKTRYRACFILAKWCKQQSLTPEETRDALFAWANGQGYRLEDRVNGIVRRVFLDDAPLQSHSHVQISQEDVAEIKGRFDKKSVRLAALAFLCYAKVHADAKGEFDISCSAVAEWIGIQQSNLSGRIMPELIDFGFLEKIALDTGKGQFTWNKTVKSRMLRVRINVPITQDGEYVLEGNDIVKLYDACFENSSCI